MLTLPALALLGALPVTLFALFLLAEAFSR